MSGRVSVSQIRLDLVHIGTRRPAPAPTALHASGNGGRSCGRAGLVLQQLDEDGHLRAQTWHHAGPDAVHRVLVTIHQALQQLPIKPVATENFKSRQPEGMNMCSLSRRHKRMHAWIIWWHEYGRNQTEALVTTTSCAPPSIPFVSTPKLQSQQQKGTKTFKLDIPVCFSFTEWKMVLKDTKRIPVNLLVFLTACIILSSVAHSRGRNSVEAFWEALTCWGNGSAAVPLHRWRQDSTGPRCRCPACCNTPPGLRLSFFGRWSSDEWLGMPWRWCRWQCTLGSPWQMLYPVKKTACASHTLHPRAVTPMQPCPTHRMMEGIKACTWVSNLAALYRKDLQMSCRPSVSQVEFSRQAKAPQPTWRALFRQRATSAVCTENEPSAWEPTLGVTAHSLGSFTQGLPGIWPKNEKKKKKKDREKMQQTKKKDVSYFSDSHEDTQSLMTNSDLTWVWTTYSSKKTHTVFGTAALLSWQGLIFHCLVLFRWAAPEIPKSLLNIVGMPTRDVKIHPLHTQTLNQEMITRIEPHAHVISRESHDWNTSDLWKLKTLKQQSVFRSRNRFCSLQRPGSESVQQTWNFTP